LTNAPILAALQQRTAELVAQRLRSEAAVIARLKELIQEAVRLGHSHRSIHEAITIGGLAASWTNYRVSLGRARARHDARRAGSPPQPGPDVSAQGAAHSAISAEALVAAPSPLDPGTRDESALPPASLNVEVLDALRRARQTASKDYSRIALERHRQRSRQPPSAKDPS